MSICLSILEPQRTKRVYKCMLMNLMSVIADNHGTDVIIGSDFNFNFAHDCKGRDLLNSLTNNIFVNCDNLVDVAMPVTFLPNSDNAGTFIDHFCVTSSLRQTVEKSYIIDSGDNLSDHLPIFIELRLNLSSPPSGESQNAVKGQYRLRWDKADLSHYYSSSTYNYLSAVRVAEDLWNCLKGKTCEVQLCKENVYSWNIGIC